MVSYGDVKTRRLVDVILLSVLVTVLPDPLVGQTPETRPPVIDVHVHTPHVPLHPDTVDRTMEWLRERLAVMDSLNVRRAVLNGVPALLYPWHEQAPDRFIPALFFPCENGRDPNYGYRCYESGEDFPEVGRVHDALQAGRIEALGEVTAQYLGIAPTDPRLEPYFELAEEHDVPVFIHMVAGPPSAAYEEGPAPVRSPNYSASAGNPMKLEEVLSRHRDLRVAVMHAGWPMLSEMVTMLQLHPNVYVDTGILQYMLPRAEYYRYLRRLVTAGFGKRIMFGSDGGPELLREGIAAIREAEFLTEEQKQDILCDNAARFLRLDENVCR